MRLHRLFFPVKKAARASNRAIFFSSSDMQRPAGIPRHSGKSAHASAVMPIQLFGILPDSAGNDRGDIGEGFVSRLECGNPKQVAAFFHDLFRRDLPFAAFRVI